MEPLKNGGLVDSKGFSKNNTYAISEQNLKRAFGPFFYAGEGVESQSSAFNDSAPTFVKNLTDFVKRISKSFVFSAAKFVKILTESF